jgi:hypothetical protein
MHKIIRIEDKVIALFEDGTYCENNNVSKELYTKIINAETEEEVYSLICPEYSAKQQQYKEAVNFINEVEESNILNKYGEAVYWDEVSQLSMPTELIKAVLKAEKNNDEVLLDTYKNFWTLMSLNPSEECRKNLYWFLNKWGLKISRCGFFVAYRNADLLKVENGEQIYTDRHSHSTRIKIGEVVTMPRENCDPDSSNSCSTGLHCGGAGWLEKNYYGTQGLVVLVNPADVTAVP